MLDQWGLESCGAFAFGYEMDTIIINNAAGTSPQNSSNQSSPAYMYAVALNVKGLTDAAQDQGGIEPDDGTSASDYFDYLVTQGSLPVNDYEYFGMNEPFEESRCDGNDNKIIKGINEILNALINSTAPAPKSMFQLGDWGIIDPEPTSNDNEATTFSSNPDKEKFLKRIKNFIASGQPVGIVIQEYNDYYNWYNQSSESVMNSAPGDLNAGYHCMVIVGYDDTLAYAANGKMSAGQGAIRIQNSWGTGFGDGGYFWMSYPAFLNSISEAYIAYPAGNVPTDAEGVDLQSASSSGLCLSAKVSPRAKITCACQKLCSSENGSASVHLILHYWFSEPLAFKSIRMTGPGGQTMTMSGGRFSRGGYRYMKRTDGSQFASGEWTVQFGVETVQKQALTLSGIVTVKALPDLPESISTMGVTGSNGQPVK